jgi:hypothetical protein
MTYRQLLEVLQRMPECYLKQQVTYQSFDEGEQITINATRVSFFSYEYKDDDPSIPKEGKFVLAFD